MLSVRIEFREELRAPMVVEAEDEQGAVAEGLRAALIRDECFSIVHTKGITVLRSSEVFRIDVREA